MALERISRAACFGGWQEVWSHPATSLGCPMRFGLYLPPAAEQGPVPTMLFLSGLTCTEDNFIQKAGAQRVAAELGLALLNPDTSPRGPGVADDAGWDLGQGASFYVDATEAPWADNYQMQTYVAEELPALASLHFPVDGARLGIFGHSMGGHGALITAFRNPDRFRSLSAFAPIVAPSAVPWGHKALGAYLGPDRAAWADWDACALAHSTAWRGPILVDQGSEDGFLATQLLPDRLATACAAAGIPLKLPMQAGYDHSYFFISTFIEEHLRHHAAALR